MTITVQGVAASHVDAGLTHASSDMVEIVPGIKLFEFEAEAYLVPLVVNAVSVSPNKYGAVTVRVAAEDVEVETKVPAESVTTYLY
jgi:hypothetical protein